MIKLALARTGCQSRLPEVFFGLLAFTILILNASAIAPTEAAAAIASGPDRVQTTGRRFMLADARVPAPAAASWAAPAGPNFSEPPTDQEILASGVLPQALAPVGGTATADENRALARALLLYQESQSYGALRDAVGPLTDFINARPRSRWCAALFMNLGIIYRQTGHMSKAMAAWQRAWDLAKNATDSKARAIADYSVGELAEFEAYLGRMETLAPLLAEVKQRPMHGSGASKISDASQGLAEMRTHPGNAFLCGPMALYRICLLEGRTHEAAELQTARSTRRGTSLTQVIAWAKQSGLNFQMAYRQPGAELIVPAVMHWKLGHFAALVKKSGALYQVQDPTFAEDIQVSQATVDEEGSGYFAIPQGRLPKGWRPVPPSEGAQVWGRGFTHGGDPNGTSPNDQGSFGPCSVGGGMTTANVHAMVVSLALHDAPLSYRTPKGPDVSFDLYYSHRDALQPAIFAYTNFGPKWTSNWISYITDNTSTTGTADLYMQGGGGESYTSTGGNSYAPGIDDQALVNRIVSGAKTAGFTRELPDGSIQSFTEQVGANEFFLTSSSDPQGNSVTLRYDANHRIATITDAAGEKTTVSYGLATDIFKVTRVTDPFGRFATFTYNADGQLASITDTLGITSSYTYLYGSGDFINTMTTPYGVSHFTYGDSTTNYRLGTERFVTLTDPLGLTERVEFNQEAPGVADFDDPSTVPADMLTLNDFLVFRNTFIWDKHQYAMALRSDGTLDYTKALLIHWLHAGFGFASRTPESVKQPLENRIWLNYAGQPEGNLAGTTNMPSAIGRVLDDGTTQLANAGRNSFGHPIELIDPAGRRRKLTYAPNRIDLLSVANTTSGATQLLWSATYNSRHEPLTVTDAAGQVTKYTYNAAGQVLLSITDALGETTNYAYSPAGLLTTIVRPFAGDVTRFTYDGFNRLSSTTDSQGYRLQFSYDTADRLTKISYPDTTTSLFSYKLLDLAATTDRLRRTTTYTYDALRRLIQGKDPLGRTTQYGYCECGAVSRITDPNGNATNFSYDVEDRLVGKVFADGTQTEYNYENATGRLKNTLDALGQATVYTYNADDSLSTVAYLNAINATPGVSFTYDPAFARMLSITDGTGTTRYAYNTITNPPVLGANQLKSITGPNGDVVALAYDALGRATNATIDSAVTQVSFDSIGRITSDHNPLGTFTISYLGATQLPVSVKSASPRGLDSLYTYYGNVGDQRLQSITNQFHNGALITPISVFQLAYDAEGEAKDLTIQKQFASPQTRAMSYDLAGQLLGVTNTGGGTNFAFGYDPGSNRTSEKIGATTKTFAYNKVNELTAPTPAVYDADGEPIKLGSQTFRWDAANRLIAVSDGANTTKFTYDGRNWRNRITEFSGKTVVSDKFYFWCGRGDQPCLETDAQNHTAVKRYLSEGLVDNGTPLYYGLDNLGSVRELVDSLGVVQASYDYDPYGVRTRLMGTEESDFGFASLFHESQTGFDLATYRDYSGQFGRWLNRDPAGEIGGVNLYAYVENDPVNLIDSSGSTPTSGSQGTIDLNHDTYSQLPPDLQGYGPPGISCPEKAQQGARQVKGIGTTFVTVTGGGLLAEILEIPTAIATALHITEAAHDAHELGKQQETCCGSSSSPPFPPPNFSLKGVVTPRFPGRFQH